MVVRYIGDAQWTALDADTKPTNAAVADTLTTLDTRRMFIHHGGSAWVEIGIGGAGGGGGFAAGGSITKSGNGTTTTISIAHALAPTPDLFYALPLNEAARGIISYSVDAVNINIAYPAAPASGTNNLSYVWGAGYVNSASGGFTPTSTTTMTNKTIGNTLKYTKQGSTPADQTNIEDIMLYSKAIDTGNNGLFAKTKQGGVIVELRAF